MSKASEQYSPTVLEVLERDLQALEEELAPLLEKRRALKKSIDLFSGEGERRRRRNTAQELYDLVKAEPGLTTRQIAQRLKISIPYVYDLVGKEAVKVERDDTGVHYVP